MTPERTRPRHVIPLILLFLIPLSGCDTLLGPGDDGDGDAPPQITELPRELSPGEIGVLRASNRFGLDLLATILDDAPEETHFLSPLSAHLALGMTMNGADGETFEAMRHALRFGDLTEEEINTSYETLIELLDDLDPAVSFQLANAIWYREGLTPREGFVTRVEDHFGAAVRGLDFGDPGAPGVINDWVAEATNDRIDEIAPDPMPANAVAFLLNAIHFEADWTLQFDPDDTHDAPFHLADGGTETIRLMEQRENFPFHQADSYRAVELPYGGQAYAMTVVVPRGDHTLSEVLTHLAGGGWDELVAGLSEVELRVLLPRFELEWERTLNDDLTAMGMGIAFNPGAQFTRMFEDSAPWIDEVRQKSFVRVDEEGTEAAAVTSVGMVDSAPPEVRADRPFIFAIRERLSGATLFLGAVVEAPPEPSD